MRNRFKIYYSFFFVIIIVMGFMLYYLLTNSMYEAESYTVNDATLSTSVIIATQGSEFKDLLTKKIVAHYKPMSVYLEVIDVSKLYALAPEKHNAIVIMHTWEYGEAPQDVKLFLKNNAAFIPKIIVVTTSGDGDAHNKDIDAITGESNLETVNTMAGEIIEKIDLILKGSKMPEQVLNE